MAKSARNRLSKVIVSTLVAGLFASACTKGSKEDTTASFNKVTPPENTLAQAPAKIANAVLAALPSADNQPTINNKTKFSSREYGVAGSPRVSSEKIVRKGGGRYQVGKPYTVRGIRYYPKEDKNYKAVGYASWYGPNFHGRLTANGEVYDQYALTAAHPTLPLPSYVRVTNLENKSSVVVRVNDRGPFSKKRVIDLSARAAQLLGYTKNGLARVKVEYAGKAPLHGLDENVLVASYSPGLLDPAAIPPNGRGYVLLANAEPLEESSPLLAQSYAASKPNTLSADAKSLNAARSLASENGIVPVVRPTSLVSSYGPGISRAGKSASALDWFNDKSMAAPDDGMGQLARIKFGPFKTMKEYRKAEEILTRFGYAGLEPGGDTSPYMVLTTVASEVNSLKAAAKSAGIHLAR